MSSAPQWAEVAKGVLAVAQVIALVAAAAWAYFKFFRGRIFTERLQASVQATPFRRGGVSALQIRAEITNTGASMVSLHDHVKVVYVFGLVMDDTAPRPSSGWGGHLDVVPVFEKHKWIESQEAIREEVLAVVDDRSWLAYRLELIVASTTGNRWSATTVVPAVERESRRTLQ
jgi:hypothetical protein